MEDLEPREGSWPATGMAGSDTLDVGFPGVAAEPVGPPGGYTSRPGFSHGGAGVAACWYGGARGVARALLRAAAKRDIGPHALAHLGAVDIALRTARAALGQAADEIDADPGDLRGEGPLRALRVRALTEAAATDVLARTGRALGAGPLSHDEAHSRAVADLTVYLRQHHAERDLARLGELVAEHGVDVVSEPACRAAPDRRARHGRADLGCLAVAEHAPWQRARRAGRRNQRRDRGRAPGRRSAGRWRPDIGAGRLARPAAAGGGHRRGTLAPGHARRRPCSPGGGRPRRPPRCAPWAPGRPR